LNAHAYIAQRFATDWMLVGPNGNTFHDSRARNESFGTLVSRSRPSQMGK